MNGKFLRNVMSKLSKEKLKFEVSTGLSFLMSEFNSSVTKQKPLINPITSNTIIFRILLSIGRRIKRKRNNSYLRNVRLRSKHEINKPAP